MIEAAKGVLRAFGFWTKKEPPYVRPAARFSMPRGPKHVLSPAFFEPVPLTAETDDAEAEAVDVYKQWRKIPAGLKLLHYFPVYQELVDKYRDAPIVMLEIGVKNGASARMWRRVMHPDTKIVGIDIEPSCARFDSPEENIFIRIGDQSSPAFLQSLIDEFGPFDLIIDDGSHMCSHMIASFDYLFLDGLKNGGVYLAEDTHTNYWQFWRDKGYSFMDMAKDLVDYMHDHYTKGFMGVVKNKSFEADGVMPVPKISALIKEIRFQDSVVIIDKRKEMRLPVFIVTEDEAGADSAGA